MARASTITPAHLLRIAVVAAFALGTMAPNSVAQRPAPIGLRPLVSSAEHGIALSMSAEGRTSRWKEGVFIGAGVGAGVGLLAVALNHSFCEGTRCNITAYYFIGPILIFSIIGGLIGSGIHKE